ncbi:hypothetical protein ACPPVS_03490 [Cellulomonas sp. McL0617]|uniref:hypothetical protein n=1 Tax=Cellulomonas sp. McL0617 TaxID=3415675 RepID=UPI003CF2F0C2
MSDAAVAEPTGAARLWDWSRTRPWWVQVLAVYAGARLATTVVFLWVASVQGQNAWTGPHPGYFPYVGFMFDGSWYRQIAESGYPAQLPVGAAGDVQQNAWAFYPLFPFLTRGVMEITRLPWEVAAPTVALLLGAVAMLLIYRAVDQGAPRAVRARPGLPLATVALVSVFPTAAVLQTAYSEALALALIAAALLLLIRRHYAWMAVAVLALGFTRAVALPMAAVVVVHAAVRWWNARRQTDTFTWRTAVGLGLLTVWSAASGLLWPAVCGWVTGVSDGYLQTQEAWRGVRSVAPFYGWTYVPNFWFGDLAIPVVVLGFALVIAVLVVPAAWRLGNELHSWAAAYVVYIAAVVEPGSSLARFLLLAYPLGAVTAGVVTRPAAARRWWFVGVLLLMFGLQFLWVREMWQANAGPDWPP